MAIPEWYRTGEAFRLVAGELGDATSRSRAYPRHWQGIGGADAAILAVWLAAVGDEVAEFHTDVLCGAVPVAESEGLDPELDRLIGSMNPLRMDLVARWRDAWWVVEIKPDAGYIALGQVMTYWYYAPLCYLELVGCGAAVLTDRVQPVIEPVFRANGITIIETALAVV